MLDTRPPEKEVYEKAWSFAEYRKVAPGSQVVDVFLDKVKPPKGATIIDFGCGTGRAAMEMYVYGLNVTLLDIASNCLDEDVAHLLTVAKNQVSFHETDLVKGFPQKAQYGFCTDIMEHIGTDDVDAVLKNILAACKHCFFMICTIPDNMWRLVGHQLHLTVKPYGWWQQKLEHHGAKVRFSFYNNTTCVFYVDT